MALAKTICYLLCLTGAVSATTLAVQQKAYPVITETKEGVKTITNPDYPRDGRYLAKLTVEMSCGGEESSPSGLLNKPLELEVDNMGYVYVMDYGDVNIKVYDNYGLFLKTIGRKGQGPGEFGGMVRISLMANGRICILDPMQHHVMVMTTKGEYLSGFPLEGHFRRLGVDNTDRLFLEKSAALEDPNKLSSEFREIPYVSSIYRGNVTGKELVHVTDFFGESFVEKASGGIVTARGGDFRNVWNIMPDGTLVGGYNGNYSVTSLGPDGKKKFVFSRQFSPIKNPDYAGRTGEKKTLPAFRAIVIDEDGSIWIELYQSKDANGFLFDIFSSDGIYIKQIYAKYELAKFKKGRVYSIDWPEEGYPSIKRYKMELVPAGK